MEAITLDPFGRIVYSADSLEWTDSGNAICLRCGQPCHESWLRTVDHGAGILSCAYCIDVDGTELMRPRDGA